jgi:hypothetical protein
MGEVTTVPPVPVLYAQYVLGKGTVAVEHEEYRLSNAAMVACVPDPGWLVLYTTKSG